MSKKSARRKARARHTTTEEKARRIEARARRLADRRKKHRQGTFAPASEPSHRRKLAWAETHIADGEALIEEWRREGLRIFQQPNGPRGFTIYAQMLKPLPDDLALVVGDAL